MTWALGANGGVAVTGLCGLGSYAASTLLYGADMCLAGSSDVALARRVPPPFPPGGPVILSERMRVERSPAMENSGGNTTPQNPGWGLT